MCAENATKNTPQTILNVFEKIARQVSTVCTTWIPPYPKIGDTNDPLGPPSATGPAVHTAIAAATAHCID